MSELGNYLDMLQDSYPHEMITIDETVNPSNFDVTAVLMRLELVNKYPLVYFSHPLNLKGEVSKFPLVTNVFANRERCALALGLDYQDNKLPLCLEYAKREGSLIPPVTIPTGDAPVKSIIMTGNSVDLREFPVVRHHKMDLGPYIDMAPVMKDPDSDAYNAAFLRTMYKSPRQLALYMSPRHNWEIVRRNEGRGRATPIVIVVSHHPAFYLGTLNIAPFETNDYEVIGSIMGESLRLTPSETWGHEFLVPADADILIEGEVRPGIREIEGPFGEWTGYYGPQRLGWVIDVKAITHRKNAVYQNIFTSHADVWVLGTIPKEGTIFNRIKGYSPNVRGVHLPKSGCGRLNCYISIDKKAPGESKQAALIALSASHFIKNVIVVDKDIDPFNEEDVLWAVATRVQADHSLDILREVASSNLDPSLNSEAITTKMIIDATKPIDKPFPERVQVPQEAMERIEPMLRKKMLI